MPTTRNPQPLTALILGAPNVVSMGIARGWQLAGHRIAEIWYPERLARTREFEQDRVLAQTAPGVTMHGLAARANVALRPVQPLVRWPEATATALVLKPDVVISLLFLDRIPVAFLDAFGARVLNLHPSILPAYRGRWPIFNMLWDRTIDAYGGMTLHRVSPEYDTGDILAQTRVVFPLNRNLSVYYVNLVKAGTGLLTAAAARYLAGELQPEPQTVLTAPQGNRDPRQARLSSAQTVAEVEWLCATIPQMTALRVAGAPEDLAVKRFAGTKGAATGATAEQDGARISFDARDARVIVECVRAR